MDIDIREEWFGMAMDFFFLSILDSVMALVWRQIFLCSISRELICGFRPNFVYALILTKCRVGMIEQYVSFIFNRLMALD